MLVSDARVALPDYFNILDSRGTAKFLDCKELEGKSEKADKILESCHFCERRCGANRKKGQKGVCGVLESRVSSEFTHMGEEPELVPSYTIFFSGCTFKCVFCQNADISQHPESGAYIEPRVLANMIKKKATKNVNWVGGDPTPNLAYILKVLTLVEKNIPQVWNSNMYLTEEAMQLLDGVIDLYLTDFKYGNDNCALKYSHAPRYFDIVSRNHLLARQQAELLIRHLVMPNHIECCTKPVLNWIAQNLENVRVNVMDQYRPEYKAHDFDEISHRLGWPEFSEALEYAKELGLDIV